MSGLEGRANILSGVQKTTREMKTDVRAHAEIAAWEISEEGKERIRYDVENTYSSINRTKKGRMVTWKMLNSVDSNVKRSGNNFTAIAGWITIQEEYFAIQDQGGVGYGAYEGINIGGMFALMHARSDMEAAALKRGYTLT